MQVFVDSGELDFEKAVLGVRSVSVGLNRFKFRQQILLVFFILSYFGGIVIASGGGKHREEIDVFVVNIFFLLRFGEEFFAFSDKRHFRPGPS